MGLSPFIKKHLQENFPQLFNSTLPAGRRVVFDDVLTRMKFAPGKEPTTTVSQILENLYGGEIRHQIFNNPEIEVYILCPDDDTNKPLKTGEHAKRRAAEIALAEKENRAVDFPAGCTISLQGISTPEGVLHKRFHMTQFFNTKYLRMALWKLASSEMAKIIWPRGKTVILDYSKDGPWYYQEATSCHRTDLTHNHGEADLACLFWMMEFPKRHFVVKTIDSDFIALSSIYLSSYQFSKFEPASLYWQFVQKNKAAGDKMQMVNMKALRDSIETKFGLRRFDLLIGFILNETDFFKKRETLHNIGPGFIMNGVGHIKHFIRSHKNWSESEMTIEEATELLTRFLRVVFQLKVDSKKCDWSFIQQTAEQEEKSWQSRWPSLIRIRKSCAAVEPVPLAFPTDEQIAQGAIDLKKNFNYWTQWWTEFNTSDQEETDKQGEKRAKSDEKETDKPEQKRVKTDKITN